METKHTVLITGAAGYVGGMLIRKFAERSDVERIIGLDKEPMPEFIEGIEKLQYLHMNTTENWEQMIENLSPDIIIHTAWDIRMVYGHPEHTWKGNIDGSDKVFDYALHDAQVKRLIHFSSVASYSSYATNELSHRFTEEEPLRESDYLYAEEKRIAEMHLESKYAERSNKDVQVSVIRPAAITGPRGRFMRIRFGLQSALSGKLKGAFIFEIIKLLVKFVPVTPKWARQFIHEDDVVGIVERLAFGAPAGPYEVFNISPPGPVVLGPDMARAVGKKVLPVYPWMVRLGFFLFWHLSRGKVPTTRGSWKGYSYPILVDGSKLTHVTGYQYTHSGYDAFYYTDGTYEYAVPPDQRRPK